MKAFKGLTMMVAGAVALSGCASSGGPNPWVCAAAGALVGGGAGALAGNQYHGTDDNRDARNGVFIGAPVGAAIGALACNALGGPAAAKQSPVARGAGSPTRGAPPLDVEFRGDGSTDADGKIVGYKWDFGDGSTSTDARAKHTYAKAGSYNATLTVTDDDGLTGQARVAIAVEEAAAAPPTATRIVLRGVNFDFDSATIRSDAAAILDAAAETLNENPGITVEVAGHTDSMGSDAYNLGLSERRARSVVETLVQRGVAEGRLTSRGYGEGQPVASNDTRDGRAQNRRVELTPQ